MKSNLIEKLSEFGVGLGKGQCLSEESWEEHKKVYFGAKP